MPMLKLFQGIPGCGKSTLARHYAAQGWIVYSYDDLRAELGDVNDQTQNALVVEMARKRAQQALEAGQNVLIDGTHVRREWVRGWEALAAALDVQLFIERVDCPLERALAQNAQRDRKVPQDVIVQMHADLHAFECSGLTLRIHIVR